MRRSYGNLHKSTRAESAQVNRLGTAKIPRLMFEFAIPALIGLVVATVLN
ncbi:MAG: hypothetical protein LBS98_03005 [Coriobacteriales bacterium]|nr:hypothetical protein [Coriobacteriales bacterium]